ncbi:hypothetical protein D9M71_144940 [compost metagenome]
MPSGKAGLTTRISTTIRPISAPNSHLPVSVMDAETGSVAMNIMPKAKPPKTKCQYQGMANIGLVSEPMALNSQLVAIMPSITPATMRQDAMRVTSSTPPPIRMARVLVSPMEPWMVPRKASIQLMPWPRMFSTPPAEPRLRDVAPANPSTAVHTSSPEICAG